MTPTTSIVFSGIAAACLSAASALAHADAVTDWTVTACEAIQQARLGTPPAYRVIAIVQTAVHEAVGAVAPQASAEGTAAAQAAAVAAANRATLTRLLPQQEAAVAAAYQAALAKLGGGKAVADGVAAGEQAAARVLAWRSQDGATAADRYRPHAAPGAYVPTAGVAVPQWPGRAPWLLASAAQIRPGPPPALGDAPWAQAYDEVKTLGARASRTRSAEQTEVARFWDYSQPAVYHAVVRSVALQPGRSVARNARLFAAASQAMDDALIAVLDAKYAYGFWRPVTAIRNGDRDDNPATELDAGWVSLIESPLHPEYPSAHSTVAGAIGEILKAEVGTAAMPELAASSPTAEGRTRRWPSVDAFVQEVSISRLWGGIHYRFSLDTGIAMGRQIGAIAASKVAASPQP